MSNDNNNKSESVNFENEQFGQRTLNSDEERQVKKTDEMKLSSTSNKYLSKTTKFKKTKSQNRYNKMKLPPISKSKKENLYTPERENTTNSVFTTSYSIVNIDPRDNDELFSDIYKAHKDIKNINKILKKLQKEYHALEESNLTNKYIIEKLLNIENDNNTNDNKNEKINDEEIKNNEKEEYSSNINNRNQSKKKKYKKILIQSEQSKKIYALKKQINSYENTLKINNNKLEELRGKQKQVQYQYLINTINDKNDEIQELNKKIEKLNNALIDNDTRMNFFGIRAQQYSDDITQMEHKVRFENNKIYENQKEIKNFIEKKEN
jgi:hypothetical protein